jgi:hypothetical protein
LRETPDPGASRLIVVDEGAFLGVRSSSPSFRSPLERGMRTPGKRGRTSRRTVLNEPARISKLWR